MDERRSDRPARQGVPDAGRPVLARRNDAPSIRTELDGVHDAALPGTEIQEEAAAGCVPNAHLIIQSGRDDTTTVRAEAHATVPRAAIAAVLQKGRHRAAG